MPDVFPDNFPPDRLVRRPAPAHMRAAAHALIVGQMAGHLCGHRVDLSSRAACRVALGLAGFGEPSITHLLDRAIAEAGRSNDAVAGGAE